MAEGADDQVATVPHITDMESYRKLAKHPLIRIADMTPDIRDEAVDIVGMAVEKHVEDLENCAQQIKEKMDAKFGGPFHCVCGQTFGFRVTHEVRSLLYVFTGPDRGVLLWKL